MYVKYRLICREALGLPRIFRATKVPGRHETAALALPRAV
jgi:hypothetical protein